MSNVTVDDSSPSITYYPSGAWNARSGSDPCSACTANPDTDKLFDNTFHDGTFNPLSGSNNFPNVPLTASINFNGTAVYVFCALAESSTAPDGDSDMGFYIDGALKGTFVKTAPGNNNVYEYTVPVFSIHSLKLGMHNLTIQNGHVNGTKSLVLLDEIIYTTVDDTTSSSSSSQSSATLTSSSSSPSQNSPAEDDSASSSKGIGSIVGPAVAVPIVVLLLVAIGICLFLKRKKRQRRQRRRTTIDSPGLVPAAWTSEPISTPPSHSASFGAGATALPSTQERLNGEAGPPRTFYHHPYAPAHAHSYSSTYMSSTNGGDADAYSNTPTSASFPLIEGQTSRNGAPPSYDEQFLKAGASSPRPKDRKTVIMNR